MSEQVAAGKLNEDVASTYVLEPSFTLPYPLADSAQLVKLALFTACLGILPITSYFGSLKYLWNGWSRSHVHGLTLTFSQAMLHTPH